MKASLTSFHPKGGTHINEGSWTFKGALHVFHLMEVSTHIPYVLLSLSQDIDIQE